MPTSTSASGSQPKAACTRGIGVKKFSNTADVRMRRSNHGLPSPAIPADTRIPAVNGNNLETPRIQFSIPCPLSYLAAAGLQSSHGLMISIPQSSKSLVFRVARPAPRDRVMPAIMASS